jgi:STE24 endopeptidase
VPEEFASQISLAITRRLPITPAPRRALVIPGILLHVALLLVFTLGGGLNALSEFWAGWLSDPVCMAWY